MSWQQKITGALRLQRESGLWRQMQPVTPAANATLSAEGRQYHHFSSNDYLGLSRHPRIIDAWQQGLNRWGAGAGASGHVTGYTPAHRELEEALAQRLGFSRALLFGSGFAANQALVFALAGKQDRLLADKLMHASLLEAAALSPATLCRFQHNSPQSLQRLLSRTCDGETLIITEGVFSMDGDRAPLRELRQQADASGSWLVVDDAHGIGVCGPQGRGSCQQQGITPDILVVTFGKAFGVAGAAILCSADVADYLCQSAKHLIYSTAMPPAQAVAIHASLHLIDVADQRREKLQHNIRLFRQQMTGLRWSLLPSETAIQPLMIGENQSAVDLAAALRQRGFWINAIRPPTVPAGAARLRITLSAAHDPQQIEQLAEHLYALQS
ncbi:MULTISPECIES: 8-amino-7-oxononanoate synthase [Tatumella]|uniref:8-amino-7-oxononanoate synthase n=1 Tax=Tatumella punctata TaxID=399969 RepID=A0ABW1VM56_9GAMM|nr:MULTISPECIES: 8-amino-7-oxononanoate synthase [unclassified Tatumella]MBS0854649.1 8-amino-7-oxononanoate synthase [Tatumella sp. JGM16]MBS0875918.1 8-amino-7-oxononanoate synthase [Tatumella sp. JGM82]MBS0890323.1 8-amino-7-oxononanoate synthase [Tatumella sp. JGM94]MBS0892570.1 8-amino-7-oxononanoate synthase [Tatumella sp. JGM130]MBS0900449.1 8-amino-7-oxononanoate synthase [Tatumella sp. JGM100]